MRHDVLVAVGRYRSPSADDMEACERDIAIFATELAGISSTDEHSPKQTIISTATSIEAAYKSRVLTRLEDAFSNVTHDDTLLVAFSCHGLTSEGDNYLLPADGSPDDLKTLIPFAWLKELLDSVVCRFKIIMIDACHSGDRQITFKAGIRFGFDERTAISALVQESSGVVYASACGHTQFAYLRPDGEQSVWFSTISTTLKSLRAAGGVVLMHDVVGPAAARTSQFVREQLGKEQTPFYFERTEGAVALGIASGAPSHEERTKSYAEITREAFRRQFEEGFGHAMPVEFSERTESRMHDAGWHSTLVVHVGPSSLRGRIALVFDSMARTNISLDDLQEVQHLAEKYSLDRVLLPRHEWTAALRRRARPLSRLQLVELPRYAPSGPTLFRDYFIPSEHERDDITQANHSAQALMTYMGKLFHIVLADLAAPTYDERYGESSFGTERAMAFEEDLVNATIARMEHTSLAVDLGCGTGRHTFYLSNKFSRVIGYDFSKGMIDVANSKRRHMVLEKEVDAEVEFEVRDVEEEPLQFESGTIDLVVGCFGMGSFLRDPVPFLSGVKEQLRPGGKLILSFYNTDALVYQAPPPWRDNGLSAVLVRDRDELEVSLPGGERFRIFCRAYPYDLLKGQLSRIFESVQIWSCPAFASFLPSDFFVKGPASAVARSVITKVDRNLAARADLPIGAYFTAVCTKSDQAEATGTFAGESKDILNLRGEAALLSALEEQNVKYTVVEHGRVRNIDDVRRELGVSGDNLVKAILAVEKDGRTAPIVLVLQGSRRLDIDKVSQWLGRSQREWRFATQKEVRRVYGLEIGGVPPFGYKEDVRVVFDATLARQQEAVCGIGNPRRSVQVAMGDLIHLAGAEIADIASR